MRTQLVRNVCRQTFAHHRRLLSFSTAAPIGRLCRVPRANTAVVRRHVPRRTLFGAAFGKPPRRVKEPEMEPGYLKLLEFRNSETENVRPPPIPDLIRGFRDFFGYKNHFKKRVNSTQAFCALRLFLRLRQALALPDILAAREALLRPPRDRDETEDHLELCKEIHKELCRRSQSTYESTGPFSAAAIKDHISALCQYGAVLEAVGILSEHAGEHQVSGRGWEEVWFVVLARLAKEGKEGELLAQADAAKAAGCRFMPIFHEIMTTFYADRNEPEAAKKWFQTPISSRARPTPAAYSAILQLSPGGQVQTGWVEEAYQELCDSNPHKALWDVIFRWAVISRGQGPEDIKRMMDTMVRYNSDRPSERPDITTINALIQAAVDKKDPNLAEEFVELGLEIGLSPDFHTFCLQLDYRIDANDFTGAEKAFANVCGNLPRHVHDIPVANKYIQYLCSQAKVDLERLLDVLGTLEQSQTFLEPATVAALCTVFLRYDQNYDVIDTLSIHTLQFSLEEREVVRNAFVAYCSDHANSTARAWDAYSLLQQYFTETPAKDRISIMMSFFKRRRPDMACTVFGHMRRSGNPSIQPTSDGYVQCLEGFSWEPDEASLKLVHNMMKLDTRIRPGTRLYNALMIAYLSCGNPGRALDFWRDITNSAEGPSYRSLEIVFRACEATPYGDETARRIWAKAQRLEVEVPDYVFTAYCAAIASQGHVEEAKNLISGMQAAVGLPVDYMT